MTVTMNLETRQRALSEWWTEETEYLFQRIERWAACARGYNRLKSQRISRGRTTMEENVSSSRWSISGNKLFIEEASWNPRFQTLNRSQASKSQPEELKLNCCGTLNYKSNGKLDSTCLETYSYDHSIYFQTIGDLKKKRNQDIRKRNLDLEIRNQDSEKRNQDSEKSNQHSEKRNQDLNEDFVIFHEEDLKEKIEWEQPRRQERFDQLIFIKSFNEDDEDLEDLSWPDRNPKEKLDKSTEDNLNSDKNQNHKEKEFNDNFVDGLKDVNDNFQLDLDFGNSLCDLGQSRSFPDLNYFNSKAIKVTNSDQKPVKRFFSSRMKSKKCQVVGDDKVWPGVLLTYTKNIDSATSPHRYAEFARGSDCYFVSGS